MLKYFARIVVLSLFGAVTMSLHAQKAMVVYVGNAGPTAPASYSEAEIKALDNRFGNKVLTDTPAGLYEIDIPVSEENEFQVIAIPSALITGALVFQNSGFGLSMILVQTGL